ncbi:hypothetical protein ZOD2009_02040 [Haladaptatus paucihalophilus DX253]|uniref:Uncharacterized protein n=1 Tax=Haladaptatus paucihalophilus DX253 TaxID=797209 RepID=E7QN90_HALPU|nr:MULTISPECIES: hypothetical protein [Haladaptatus]EFW93885.1 hypothetical protein ZOD2009_02040 [Haladaptatus paucihalophilus DX253]GKZ13240.1 hypothetical protein HAL_11210 [Haladaptatus sp. T7]SHK67853.1 hypothetical protein SAMN05444342_2079 [Haladaptatus paucihalophilus DX253]
MAVLLLFAIEILRTLGGSISVRGDGWFFTVTLGVVFLVLAVVFTAVTVNCE